MNIRIVSASFLICTVFAAGVAFSQQDEKLTITTYYPSPTGRYNTLWTNTLGVGDTNADGSITNADIPDPLTKPGEVWISGNMSVGRNVTNDANIFLGNLALSKYATLSLLGGAAAGNDGLRLHYSNNPAGDYRASVIDIHGKYFAIRSTDDAGTPTNRIFVNLTNGYVGIGTSSPQSILHVKGLPYTVAGDHSRLALEMGAEGANDAASFTFRNATFPVLGGIGYNSPARTAYGGLNSLNIVQALNANLTFATSNTVRATIDGSGAMHYGAYTPGNAHINAFNMEFGGYNPVAASKNATILFHDWGVRANQLRYQNGVLYWESSSSVPGYGTTTTPGLQVGGDVTARAFYYSSDRALKTDIKPAQNSLEKILSLSGKTFKWKQGGRPDMGLIAQDVEQVYPELVSTDPVTGLKSVEYGNLISPLIEAVKELHGQVIELHAEIEELKRR